MIGQFSEPFNNTGGEVFVLFVFLIGQVHYLSGALYRGVDNKYTLISLDQMDREGEKINSNVKPYIEHEMKRILDENINLTVVNKFDCLKNENNRSCNIQQDNHNCGPLSLAIVENFELETCRKIANNPQLLNDVVKKSVKNIAQDTNGEKVTWRQDEAMGFGRMTRDTLYNKYTKEFQEKTDEIREKLAEVESLIKNEGNTIHL